MDISALDYNLPKERIAQHPAMKRDESKLLVYKRSSGEISHLNFKDLPEVLGRNYKFIRNDAAVLKARIFAKKSSGANVECLLLNAVENSKWIAMIKPAKRLAVNSTFGIDGVFSARVLEKFDDGRALLDFEENAYGDVISLSEAIGAVPLPPYIVRDQRSPDYDRREDNERYETVYANSQKRVAVAAPTAGLHFTKELVETLKNRGSEFYNLTLHVGIGTFKPIQCDKIEEHKMHSETYEIPADTLKVLKTEPRENILCIGTTSLRASEDFCRKNPDVALDKPYISSASLFVYPPQRVISSGALITNFHLPRSTLMCLVGAFIAPESENGIEILKDIYKIAIERDYRFFSYGDAMLIL